MLMVDCGLGRIVEVVIIEVLNEVFFFFLERDPVEEVFMDNSMYRFYFESNIFITSIVTLVGTSYLK